MGKLFCPRCRATTEADSIEQGRDNLNHAVGLYIGKPCYDGKVELQYTGTEKKNIPQKSSPKKSVFGNLKDKMITSKSDSDKE